MSEDRYIHLHTHSEYSILDGLSGVYTLVRTAGNLGQPAIALTDHERLSGAVSFWDAISWYNSSHAERHSADECDPKLCHLAADCAALERCPTKGAPVPAEAHAVLAPMRGILGLETYVAADSRFDKLKGDAMHLVLLARDETGWANLRQLSSLASLEGTYYKARIDWELLERHHQGLIALSACLGGHLARTLSAQGPEAADALVVRYRDLFGPGNYWLELQWHNDQDLDCRCANGQTHPAEPGPERVCSREQHDLNRYLLDASQRLDVPLVVTNDLHYARRADHDASSILLATQQKLTLAEVAEAKRAGKSALGFDTADFYVKSRKEMGAALTNWYRACQAHDPATAEIIRANGTRWLDATLQIADSITLTTPFETGKLHFPRFPIPDSYLDPAIGDEEARYEAGVATYLSEQVWQRATGRYPDMDEATRRLIAYELQAVTELGFGPYFLITADFVDYARREGIDVGLGRGSAPGSVITYILGITDLDPIHYGLTAGGIGLTRFLNPTVLYRLELDAFGQLAEPYRSQLAAPDAEQMEAELAAALNTRVGTVKDALAAGLHPDSGERLDEAKLRTYRANYAVRRAKLLEEWTTLKRWGRANAEARAQNKLTANAVAGRASLVEPLWRWLRAVGDGHAPGERNAHHSLIAHFLGLASPRITAPADDPLPLLPSYEFCHSRKSMPDIDIDFTPGHDGREKVMRYVTDKYGADHVCQIATFGTMQAKSAIKDVARALGMNHAEGDQLTFLIPKKFQAVKSDDGSDADDAPGVSLREMLSSEHPAVVEGSRPLREAMAANPLVERVIRLAAQLEGTKRTVSTHACGVLITPRPVTEYVPVEKVDKGAGQQAVFDGPTLTDQLGLLKVDFLGLKNLKTIRATIERVAERGGPDVSDWPRLPDDDPAAMKLLRDGHTLGIFQFGSDFATSQVLKPMKPRRVQDLMVATALGRPGPMEYIPTYISARARGSGEYGDPVFEKYARDVLEETYGVLVYQEQVMRLSIELSGFTLSESDNLRKATAKKDAAKLASIRESFVAGAVAHGAPEAFMERYWDDVLTPFAAYSFNKSHSAAYALTAYKQAYLAAHFGAEYLAALATVEQHEQAKERGAVRPLAKVVAEARKRGFEVAPVDINTSTDRIEIEDRADGAQLLRMSLVASKGIGDKPIEAIVAERDANGRFAGFGDFLARTVEIEKAKDPDTGRSVPNPINKTVVLNLIKLGAFDAFDDRAALLDRAEAYFKTTSAKKRAAIDWSPSPDYDPSAPKPKDYLDWETELLGFAASASPIDSAPAAARERVTHTTADLAAYRLKTDKEARVLLGTLSGLKFVANRSGNGGRFEGRFADTEGEAKILYWKPRPQDGDTAIKRFAAFEAELATLPDDAVLLTASFSADDKYGDRLVIADWERVPLPRSARASAAAQQAVSEAEAKAVASETKAARLAAEQQLFDAAGDASALDELLDPAA